MTERAGEYPVFGVPRCVPPLVKRIEFLLVELSGERAVVLWGRMKNEPNYNCKQQNTV